MALALEIEVNHEGLMGASTSSNPDVETLKANVSALQIQVMNNANAHTQHTQALAAIQASIAAMSANMAPMQVQNANQNQGNQGNQGNPGNQGPNQGQGKKNYNR